MEELYVLDGELTIGTQHYAAHTYACLAAGRLRGACHSERGAVVLAM